MASRSSSGKVLRISLGMPSFQEFVLRRLLTLLRDYLSGARLYSSPPHGSMHSHEEAVCSKVDCIECSHEYSLFFNSLPVSAATHWSSYTWK